MPTCSGFQGNVSCFLFFLLSSPCFAGGHGHLLHSDEVRHIQAPKSSILTHSPSESNTYLGQRELCVFFIWMRQPGGIPGPPFRGRGAEIISQWEASGIPPPLSTTAFFECMFQIIEPTSPTTGLAAKQLTGAADVVILKMILLR